MELKHYLQIILKRLWILILLPVAAAGASAYISFYILQPVYESDTTLYVINRSMDSTIGYNDMLVSQQLVKDYRELVKSRAVTVKVIEELKLDSITSEALAGKISVNYKNDTRIIEIKVRDTSPEMARDIARKLGQVFTARVVELMKVENVSMIDEAQLPSEPVEPSPYLNIAIGFILGLAVGAGIIFLIEYLDDTLETSEDVEKQLGMTVLATIPVFDIK